MKKLVLLCCLALLTMAAQAQSKWLEKYASMKGVERVYVSPTMMKMVGSGNMAGMDVSRDMIKRVNGVLVLSAEGTEAIKALRADYQLMPKRTDYEVLMQRASDGGKEQTTIYGIVNRKRKNTVIKEILFFQLEPKEAVCIQLLGNFTEQDIQGLSNGSDKLSDTAEDD